MSMDGEDEGVRPTGKFRVYLGAAAGVGKTCAMLDEGWRRFQRGADVVIGFVETHKRPYTVEQIRDLPVVPRKHVRYRDADWEEMDVDAVLARHPKVVLIDELAHTNVPDSGRHEKRWEDVLEILDAGIAVITTVNIQHIESVADAVERITGVGVRERVPDWVVRRADQLELIDSSADQLRRRMLHGNIYPENKVPAALNGFFRAENLAALRELSLRFVADETEEELLEYLRSKGAGGELWETTERIMVAVTGAPGNAAVIRRAARIAARVKAPLIAINVISGDADSTKAGTSELEELVKAVGGTWQTAQGDDVAKTIFAAAIDQQITQIVVGTSRLTRWQSVTRGSVIQQILRMASENDIDLHVIARRDDAEWSPCRRGRGLASREIGESGVRRRARCQLHALVEVCQCLGPAGVPGEVLGHRHRVGRAVGLAQGKDGLVHDVLIGSVADAAIDRPGDTGRFARLGHSGRFHVDGAESPLEDGAPDVVIVEEPVGGHESARGLPRGDRMGVEDGSVGIELHSFGNHERAHGECRVEPPGDPDHHDMVDRAGRQCSASCFGGQGRAHARDQSPDPPCAGSPGMREH